MPRKILNTEARQKLARARDRDTKLLEDRGWKHDGGPWHISPYTSLRYYRREALHVEELRAWGESESAFLYDKNHSIWVKEEAEDNKLISFEELEEKSKQRALEKKEAIDGCYR